MPETYYSRNKERVLARCKARYENNKEKVQAINKTWRDNNRHKNRISQWKLRGIIDGDFDSLNEVFEKETHCWICWKPYIGTRTKALDHDWDIKNDDNVRYICCKSCNSWVVG